jgi:hypothetical protein
MPALLTRTLFTRTPKQIISATLRYGGEGVDQRNIFIIAIHKPAPEKLCQRGQVASTSPRKIVTKGQFPFGVICG